MTRGPSDHLTWNELACRDAARTPYPQAFIAEGRAAALAALFEAIRAIWDAPLAVNCGYRTAAHNRAVGGAPKSQHVEGRAVDLQPPAGVTVEAFYAAIASRRDTLPGLGGLGKYRTFVHVDVRPGRLVVWNGRAATKEGPRV